MNNKGLMVYKGVVHPELCDVMGHMTTRHYVTMFDDASYHFLYSLFGWSGEHAKTLNRGWADVKHVIEYQDEVAAGELLEIQANLTKLGTKSITVTYTMLNIGKNKAQVATLESTSVYFDTLNRKAVPLTSEMKIAAGPYI
ncbi:acyl-CoA thioesterase [Thalassotalea nanhaiensis]|uniref:Acyl-CoA thioesterase n=1 Tax=Thalassotalea nanhaiensis TaxID=3065648 RepID=A0ABY9TIV9_9GAMM|nr:acyl-CoA thioesterase [Colwelliaceae bacterium SQ345]